MTVRVYWFMVRLSLLLGSGRADVRDVVFKRQVLRGGASVLHSSVPGRA